MFMINFKLRFSLLLFVFVSSFSFFATAQESVKEKSADFWRRVAVGGYVSFQVGNVTGIVVSPEVQVRIVDQLYGGLGLSYQYYWYKNYYLDTKPNPLNILIIQQVFMEGEFFSGITCAACLIIFWEMFLPMLNTSTFIIFVLINMIEMGIYWIHI